ncbi:Fatty acyl-CoA reductase wat [Eumeta japonica]|uniref:Fatty acyl-CoA reductase n=1 Tax=Eumeta variegata TaxID=151549 RepID=A0A4C1YV55_EUMVA|nr:Fatty acyl-CoA reductase wat [Eumeta japonica]
MELLRETLCPLAFRGHFDGLLACSHSFPGVRKPLYSKLFHKAREINPKGVHKVVAVSGDMEAPGLGLSERDRNTLLERHQHQQPLNHVTPPPAPRQPHVVMNTPQSIRQALSVHTILIDSVTSKASVPTNYRVLAFRIFDSPRYQVTVVLNAAATVRFDEKLSVAFRINVRGTREVIQLARECRRLRSFTHVSTAFSNTHYRHIEEKLNGKQNQEPELRPKLKTGPTLKPSAGSGLRSRVDRKRNQEQSRNRHCERERGFYPLPITLETIEAISGLDEALLDNITPTYVTGNGTTITTSSSRVMGRYPNTYCFTKAVAEEVVRRHAAGMPVCVFRPSIVISTHEEPVRGWTDSLYGPTGLLVGIGTGVSLLHDVF